jgi:hypothetical protein
LKRTAENLKKRNKKEAEKLEKKRHIALMKTRM